MFTGGSAGDGSESEVDAGGKYLFCRGEAMQPVRLRGAFHEQQTAIFQEDIHFFTGLFVFEGETAVGPERERADGPFFFQFGFVVAVPAHAFTAIVVQVEQTGVISFAGFPFCDRFESEHRGGPGQCAAGNAGVSVFERMVAVPGHHAAGYDSFAENDRFVVPPVGQCGQ